MLLPYPRWRRTSLSVAAAIGLAACSDEPLAPDVRTLPGPRGTPLFSVSASQRPQTFPNALKYRDNSIRNATGRDGGASLTARALLGRDGMVDLEVTSGDFDTGGTPPGNLDKVQVKGLDTDGQALWTLNHNKLRAGGYWSARYGGLTRGSRVQVQSNISGVDPNRVGVVTLVEEAKRRPDLAVIELTAPATAVPTAPVTISATVRELNGDVGARASCVLSVDGAELDRSDGIWVDAGGVVTCAFTHAFATGGTKQLTVDVAAVRPGDWDGASNTLSRSITIHDAQDFAYWAFVMDRDVLDSGADTVDIAWSTRQGESGSRRREQAWHTEGRYQHAHQSGWLDVEIPFPLSMFATSQASGDDTISMTSEQQVPRDWGWTYTSGGYTQRHSCAQRFTTSAAGRIHFSVCSGAYGYDGSVTYRWSNFYQWRWAGDVTYRSRGFDVTRHRSVTGETHEYSYEWNYDTRDVAGMPLPTLGSTYTMDFRVTGADGIPYGSTARMALRPYATSHSQPYGCQDAGYTWGDYTQTGTICHGRTLRETVLHGSATGGSSVP